MASPGQSEAVTGLEGSLGRVAGRPLGALGCSRAPPPSPSWQPRRRSCGTWRTPWPASATPAGACWRRRSGRWRRCGRACSSSWTSTRSCWTSSWRWTWRSTPTASCWRARRRGGLGRRLGARRPLTWPPTGPGPQPRLCPQAPPVPQPHLAAQPRPSLLPLVPDAGWGQRHQEAEAGGRREPQQLLAARAHQRARGRGGGGRRRQVRAAAQQVQRGRRGRGPRRGRGRGAQRK